MDRFDKTELRRLFDVAAAMSIAMDCSLDAEYEMAAFAKYSESNNCERLEVIELFRESFGEEFYMIMPPVELWRFCAHTLRWPELQEEVARYKKHDIEVRGSRRSGVWDDILEAFEDNWEGRQYYRSFSN